MAGGVGTIGNLQGKVNASNALVVTLDGGTGSASVFLAGNGTAGAPSYSFTADATKGLYSSGTNVVSVSIAGVLKHSFDPTGYYNFSDSAKLSLGASEDVNLFRDEAAALASRNGTNGQTLRVYATFTDASNYERMAIVASASAIDVLSQGAGTGTASTLRFGVTDAQWQINSGGHLLTVDDNLKDIGASGATRPRNIFAGTRVTAPAYTVGASAGASGSGTVLSSITVVNGIVTAISVA